MKWKPGRRSGDIEDRRSRGGGFGGGGMPIPIGRMGGGGIGTIIVLVIVYLLFIKGGGGGGGFDVPGPEQRLPSGAAERARDRSVPGSPNEEKEAVRRVRARRRPGLLAPAVPGGRQAVPARQAGPLPRPGAIGLRARQLRDRALLLPARPEGLHRPRLLQRAQAALPGALETSPQAYVLAHEIGHHVQQQLGIEQQVRQQSQQNPGDANALSVRLELQADCLAGVWARSTYDRGILESGDLQEGLTAAAAVGDDRIQQQAQGRIDPETFTHGTSEQRAHWLQTGFDSGKLEACDTFSGDI